MKITLNRTWTYLGLWLAAAVMALMLALVSPNEASVMGHWPSFMSQTLSHQPIALPQGLPSERTLALITFQRDHRAQADSWIEGLNLQNDTSISWVRVPVLNDPGTVIGRSAAESRLLKNYPADKERDKLVPVFTDRAEFVRSTGLNGVGQAYAVVVNRQGEVLARVGGQFDADKAQLLRETLGQTLQGTPKPDGLAGF